jgi:hypothetical protein
VTSKFLEKWLDSCSVDIACLYRYQMMLAALLHKSRVGFIL